APIVWMNLRVSDHAFIAVFISLGVACESLTVAIMLNRTLQRALSIPSGDISPGRKSRSRAALKTLSVVNWTAASILSVIMFVCFMVDGTTQLDTFGIRILSASISVTCVCFTIVICKATLTIENIVDSTLETHRTSSAYSYSASV